MMALIDFMGFRVLATSVLPISKKDKTLVYGSDDAGRSCHHADAEVNALMERAGNLLNLKGHLVTEQNIPVFAPCDIEVHRGKDGNIYVLDTARVFPPEFPFRLFGAIKIPSFEIDGEIVKMEVDKGQLDLLTKNLRSSKTDGGVIFFSDKGSINKTASAILGTQVRGDAYLIYGYKIDFSELQVPS